MKHTVEHLRFPEATVEAITEFRQVAGQMLGADPMVDAPDVTFNIGDQGMNPWPPGLGESCGPCPLSMHFSSHPFFASLPCRLDGLAPKSRSGTEIAVYAA